MTLIKIQSSYMTLILEAEHSLGHSFHAVYLCVCTTLTEWHCEITRASFELGDQLGICLLSMAAD